MANNRGPRCRRCRREGARLYLKGDKCHSNKCIFEKRQGPPGMHGATRKKPSDYGIRLREKQKARRMYGMSERQFKQYFQEAGKMAGATGENLLRLLELRLDNIVYRLGFAPSRALARQLVNHGHFQVNGRRSRSPSSLLRVGDVVEVGERSRGLSYFKVLLETGMPKRPLVWLERPGDGLMGKVLAIPERDAIDTQVEEQLIIEYYSR